MKKLFFITCIFSSILTMKSQVTINSETYFDGNLVVEPSNRTMPSYRTGVIVPKVEELNLTDPKEDGLLVFLNNPSPPLVTGEQNGFYYWDNLQNKWIGIQALTRETKMDKSQFFVSGVEFDTTNGSLEEATSPAKIFLNNLATNNTSICSLSGGSVTISKKGWYYIQMSVTLRKDTNPATLRDMLCFQLYKNGSFAQAATGVYIRTYGGYANDSPAYQTFTSYAPLQLAVGDKIDLFAEIDYVDQNTGSSGSGSARRSGSYTIPSGTVATLSAKYLGDF